ncbi:winged helix-turn-helix transcriptional regulator [Weissella uvarum]|nr:winged helix-turn-helix transcriptional regulator [Weissella uvarum]
MAANINQDIANVEDLLIALGDKKRLELLTHLINAYQHKPLCVKDLAELTNLSRPAVSHHLKILKEAGIINFKKNGTQSYYYLDNVQDNVARMKILTDDLVRITC